MSEAEKSLAQLELDEERQRLWWKTVVLVGSSLLIGIFFASALFVVFFLIVCRPSYQLEIEHGVFVALLLAVPSLLAIQLFKMVDRSTEMKPEDIEKHPAFKLAREIVNIFAKKFGGH